MEVMFTFSYQQLLYFFFVLPSWAFADSALYRLVPLWVDVRGLEFTWDYILHGLEANANLVRYFF
ncbi:hypothetical protein AHAS_Ahas13G0396900 [Arachis hypogaea]